MRLKQYLKEEKKKVTIAKAKDLAGKHSSWADFKHKLMKYLDIPEDQFTKWDVPMEWQYAYKRSGGWSHKDTVRQLKLPDDFKLNEEFIGVYKYGGKFTDIYENPSPNEIRFMPTIYNEPKHPELMDCSIRFLALGSKQKLFIWASDGGVHYHVLEWLMQKKKVPSDVYGREPADIVSGYASPQGNKMKFERGYGLGTRGYDIAKDIWDWLRKYFVNMPQLMNYIEKDGSK